MSGAHSLLHVERQCYGKQLHNPLVDTRSEINLTGELCE